jgi:hypothetical protein
MHGTVGTAVRHSEKVAGGGGVGGASQWNLNREYNRIELDIHSVEEKKEKKNVGLR